jgi:hypothetical protein
MQQKEKMENALTIETGCSTGLSVKGRFRFVFGYPKD